MTPGCSLCGYAVEVVRSCFRSKWRLFNNSDTLTPGRYFFGDDSTPVYPGWHNLWSRYWVDPPFPDWDLGEDPDTRRQWASGAPIGPVAGGALVGSADCIANGDRWPLPVVPVLVGGFDARCPGLLPAPLSGIDVRSSANWCFWAEVLERVYTDPRGAQQQVAAALNVPANGFFLASPVGLTPQLFALLTAPPDPIVLGIAGTTNALQWIAQVNYGVGAPSDAGGFATNSIWYSIASDILNRLLAAGASPTQDIVIAGHSLGAAVAAVLAVRLRQHSPARKIQVLLMASPRPGDARLSDLLRQCETVTIHCDGDIVSGIPTNLGDIPLALQPLLSPFYPPGCPLWAFPPNRFRVTWSGQVQAGAASPGPAAAVIAVLVWAFSIGNTPDLSDHLPGEYRRRLCSPAIEPVVWLDAWDVDRPDGDPVIVWPNRVDAPNSPEVTPSFVTAPKFRTNVCSLAPVVAFRCTPGMRLPTAVAQGTDFSIYAVVAIHREPGDGLHAFIGAPIQNGGLGAGVSWGATGPASGTWAAHGLGFPVLLPDGGAECVPLLLSVSLCAGTLSAQLEFGSGVIQGVQLSVPPDPSGLVLIGQALFVSSLDPNPSFLLAELLVYDQCLSTADQQSVLDYLRVKWLVHAEGITTEGGTLLATESGDVLLTE